ncbi:MAG: PorT family protein [Muribaculaceae bacterium]|nr:PorT family protein [Muribaculaceae bacterium]
MKTIKHLLLAAVAVIAFAGSANAQFKFGPRVGINVNSLHFNKDVISSDNRTGFNAGVEAEFTVPVLGIGLDASLMYVRRNQEMGEPINATKHCDYFEIPVNVKWKMNIPLVAKVVKPYIFTGPSFAFLTSKRAITEAYKNKSVDTSWNFGLGLEFFSHLQVSAYYGFGLNKTIIPIHVPGVNTNATPIDGKTHCWTVTAAWLF